MRRKDKHNNKQKSKRCIIERLEVVNEFCASDESFDNLYMFKDIIEMYNILVDKYNDLLKESESKDVRLQNAVNECNNYHVLWTELRRQHNTLKKLVGRMALNSTYFADIANKASKLSTRFTEQDNKIIMSGEGINIELEVEDA